MIPLDILEADRVIKSANLKTLSSLVAKGDHEAAKAFAKAMLSI